MPVSFLLRLIAPLLALTLGASPAAAANLEGKEFGVAWALPFIGMLLSIALLPLLTPHLWEHHQGKIAAFWSALVILPMFFLKGAGVTIGALANVALLDYIPFILLLVALFTTAGGVLVAGNIRGSPGTNTLLLLIGAILASFIGTTGASMVMIRPMLRANDNRKHTAHVFVFFIFLVSNIGGSLTPLGDPPLFLGFLRGVEFFWTTTHLFAPTMVAAGAMLAIFYALDRSYYAREDEFLPRDPTPDKPVRLRGLINVALIGVVIAAILTSARVDLGTIQVLGAPVEIANLLREAVFVIVALASLALSDPNHRRANGFSWGPMAEVAKLFAGIFIAIIPVLAMLKAGRDGAFAPLVALVSHSDGTPNNAAYFWLTGGLSSFLDNAPTYLVFFELAGGDAQKLMTEGAKTLTAISAGAVFMGANSYIGNAPNFMVYAMAKEGGVKMPSFFGYMLWSGAILIPIFALLTPLFFL